MGLIDELSFTIDRSNFFDVLSACVGKVMAIQDACSDQVVKGQNWNVDFGTGQISFGDDTYPVQFIGSESSANNSWKWGWDNINGFSDSIIVLAKEAEKLGTKWGLQPLCIDSFDIDDFFNGHNLAIVACGISENNYCYYRGPHSGGALLMAFSQVPDSVFEPIDLPKFVRIAMQCLQQFPMDHKIFIESFLQWNKTGYKWVGQTIEAEFNEKLYIEFEQAADELRVSSINTK